MTGCTVTKKWMTHPELIIRSYHSNLPMITHLNLFNHAHFTTSLYLHLHHGKAPIITYKCIAAINNCSFTSFACFFSNPVRQKSFSNFSLLEAWLALENLKY